MWEYFQCCFLCDSPSHKGGVTERDKGGGLKSLWACGHLQHFQHPCKPLDSFSGLNGEL